jgi:large subunit ribosomal protein L10
MNREQKAAVVEELTEQIRAADAIFAVDYRGISVAEAAELRTKLRDAGTRFRIVKNSLTERATDQAGADGLRELLQGPTALAFVAGDAALAAKALNDAARTLGTLEFKGGLMNGNALSADDIRSIARLPAREVLHGQLVGTIAAPLNGLVRTLNALIQGLALQLGQIAEQGLVSGEASEAPAQAEAEAEAAPGPEAEAEAAAPAEPEAGAAPEPEAEAASEPEPEAEAEAAPEPEAEAEAAPEPEAEAVPAAEPEGETTSTETEESESEASADEPQAEEPKEE